MMNAGTVAVIEIGSTGIRLLVANVHPDGSYEILENAGKPSSLGRDAFTTGSVSREATHECIAVLRGFREILKTYAIEPPDTRVVAMSAIRDAENRDAFVDRVAMRTGFKVLIVEDIEENHYMYLAVQHALGDDARHFARSNSIILEVGGGSTELMLLRRGRIIAAHSLRLGTVRVEEQVKAASGSGAYLMRILSDNVRTVCASLDEDLKLASIKHFMVIGSDARFAAQTVGTEERENYRMIPKKDFIQFVDRLHGMTVDEIVSAYRLPYGDAEAAVPGLLIASLFLERTAAEDLVVPNVSIREGIVLAIAGGKTAEIERELHAQIMASTRNLGKRYHFDENHAVWVASSALFLFDRLASIHGLSARERLLLDVAAMLHDIGMFIRPSSHQKHSEYLILNSEIFGLQRDQLVIIANIVRFHRKAGPAATHANYMSLSREDRLVVLKLCALLRLADALDRSHTQHFTLVELEIKEDHLLLHSDCAGDLSLERLSLTGKSDIFEDVFGLKVIII